jgi:hypothetical protein
VAVVAAAAVEAAAEEAAEAEARATRKVVLRCCWRLPAGLRFRRL